MKKTIILLLLTLFVAGVSAKEKTKVACVGNSVTYGYGIEDREHYSYPVQLQRMLGDDYDVRNFGRSSATLTSRSPMAYTKQPEYRAAMDFKADIVVIHLGLNDTDPRWWPNYSEEFIPEYRALIDSFRVANPKAKIWICLLSPIGHQHHRFQSGTRDWHKQVSDAIRTVAYGVGVGLIDLFTPLYNRPDLLPDALHPNAEGAGILARTVYQNITGDYGGLRMPLTYSDNMVLQRDQPLVISGTANVGDKVEVKLDGSTLRKSEAQADTWGRWRVELPAQKAGGPYTLSIKSSGKRGGFSLKYNNVWVGDVWLCSGQSNMEFMLGNCATAAKDLSEAPHQQRLHLLQMSAIAATDNVEWPKEVLDSVNALKYLTTAGWQTMETADAARMSAVAYHFGKTLAESLEEGVHIGLICNPVGGTPAEAWIDRWTLQWDYPQILYKWLDNDHIQGWVRGRAAKNITQALSAGGELQRHPYEPCYMYEAGIRPLEGTALKGVIWYQGESNAHNTELHELLFPLLEKSWRKAFDKADLPFYFVQLSSLNRPSWPRFRNSQRLLAERLPYTWMAVSTDVGDSLDVHPTRKQQVGQRLALQALRHSYGRDIISQGPTPVEMSRDGGSIVVSFDCATMLRTSDGAPVRSFEVAGSDGLYHAATATVEGKTVRVRSAAVPSPVSVRYGWQPFTRANLVNEAGLPASTFIF
ncbi:MAG: sialate O-acetylesterase [Bacteroidaceae bacterium]|nr:sialate O-acetylesterase [Bacteroidaceae bacterium]